MDIYSRSYLIHTPSRTILPAAGEVTVTRALEAVLSVMPLDSFVDRPLERMEV